MNTPLAHPPEVPLIGSPYDLRVSLSEGLGESAMRASIESGDRGFVHSFTTGSAVDGPGLRVVGWLAGCQFRCVYCHNPDTWKMTNGMPVTLSRAIEVVSQYKDELKITRGGLTISGGEPLMQRRFVLNLFSAVKKLGVHTALDTNGYFGGQLSDADLNLIDLVLLDLKAMTPGLHRRLTGMDNKPILEFAERLAAAHRPIWVRFVLVPGWTDNLVEVQRIATFAAKLGNVERVDVLPFHQLGRFKWDKLHLNYPLRFARPPSADRVKKAIAKFSAVGLPAY
jgi:pyruvate formate lyase activating enzyme